MNILYGIQGTGHGHIIRAKELLPELSKHASVDVLISGYACQLDLETPVKYRKHGISLGYDSNGGVSILETLKGIKPIRFLNDIQSISLDAYDLVISDYEPITAWAGRMAKVPSVALSHQAAFLTEQTPRPVKSSPLAEAILQYFAPTDHALGFHFKRYDTCIEPPVIRSEIRQLNPVNSDHITVYLPAYDHRRLAAMFRQFSHIKWHVFSPVCTKSKKEKNVQIYPVSNRKFLKSLESCSGVLTSAGFETSAEAMYLGKKLMVVPIRNQYEQLCNAAALEEMGVTAVTDLEKSEVQLWHWLEEDHVTTLDEIADPAAIVRQILKIAEGERTVQKKSVFRAVLS